MKVYFISDLHFGHTNIIKYENRPFTDVEEMDKGLIDKWNSVVTNEDIVWFLGDLSMRKSKAYLTNIVSQLKGHKKMIRGNHDVLSEQCYRDMGFEFVSSYPVMLKGHFILSHIPLPAMFNARDNYFYIYGHVHGSPHFETKTENSRCVCCERQNFEPMEIAEFNDYVESEIADEDIFDKKLF